MFNCRKEPVFGNRMNAPMIPYRIFDHQLPATLEVGEFLLVLYGRLRKLSATMKRTLSLLVLLGLIVVGVTACSQSETPTTTEPAPTNAPAATP